MRNHTTPLLKQLTSSGSRAPTAAIASGTSSVSFQIQNVPGAFEDMLNYVTAVLLRVTLNFDQAASGGSAVTWDKLFKGVSSAKVFSDLLGDTYSHINTRGPVLGHLIQVVAGGYRYPQPVRAQIAAADGDSVIELYLILPYSYECLANPMETAPWTGLFDGGEVEVIIAGSGVFDGDSTGAVLEGNTTVRAAMEYLPMQDKSVHVPCEWRERTVQGSTSEHELKNFGAGSGHRGTAPGAGLALLAQLTDATGIGLSGQDGADNITRFEFPERGQQSMFAPDLYYMVLNRMTRGRVGGITDGTTTVIHDGGGWPYTLAATPSGALNNAQALLFPIIMPGLDLMTSKVQRVIGDRNLHYGFTAEPSGTTKYVSWEFLEYNMDQLAVIAKAMGLDPDTQVPERKALKKVETSVKKLRYTRTKFVTPAPEDVEDDDLADAA